jgi:hypothetical protein
VGVLTAVPTAVTGLSDLADVVNPDERSIGTAHALGNLTAVVLYGGSYLARRRGRRRAGVRLAMLGAAVVAGAGFLGGHLAFRKGVGVDQTVFRGRLEDWTPVLDEQELAEAKARRVTAGGTDILLYRPNRQDLRAGKPLQPSRWPAAQGAGHRRAGQVPLASEHLQLGGRLDPARPRDRAAALLPGPPPGRNHRGARPPLG